MNMEKEKNIEERCGLTLEKALNWQRMYKNRSNFMLQEKSIWHNIIQGYQI